MFEDKVLKHKRAEGYYRRNAELGNVDGAWKNFVEANKVPDPSSMKLAELPRSEWDNMNTPDLEQTPNSVLKPGETLEDFDVTFRKPNAEGGFQQLVQNTDDGSRPGYQGTRQTSSQKKSTLYKKLLNDLPEGYLEDYKKIFLKDRGDGTFSLKPGDAPEGILDMEKKYGEIIKKMKTRQGEVKNITRKIGEMNSAIKQSLEKDNLIVSGLSDADVVRKTDLKIVGDIDLKAPKGMNTHHFMPLAGVEGESINLSSTKNTAFIDEKLNKKMSPYDKRLKANQKEQIKLLNEKPTGYKIRIKQLNFKAKNIYKEAGKKVPSSKGYLGYSQIEVKPDGTYDIKVTGIDSNKSFAGLKGEEIFYKNISKDDKIKVRNIADLTSELGGKEKLQKLLFEGGGTKVERGLVQRIVSGGGKMAISMLNPAELIKLKNLIGPGALGIMAAFEAGVVTDDVLRMGKPLNESLASNWLFKSFRPHSEEFEKQKNLLQSGKLTGSQREYALEMMKMEQILKEDKRIKMMESTQLVDGAFDDNFTITSQEEINTAKQKLRERFDRVNDYVLEEGTGRQLENEAAMAEKEATEMAKKKFSPLFGDSGTPLVNMAPRPRNMGRGPMTEQKRMNLDFGIPGYTPYNKAYTPSNKEISDYYQTLEKPRALNPGEGTLIRMNLASRDGNRSIYGANDKFAEGGLANLMKKYYD